MYRIKEDEEEDVDDTGFFLETDYLVTGVESIMVMDDTKLELLISAVQSRPPIWQNDHLKHHDSHVLSPLWKEIAELIKEDSK